MAELPPDSATWKRRAEWMLRNFCSNSKTSLDSLRDILNFLNGDTASNTVIHWCVLSDTGECCHSDSESVAKLVKLLLPWFGRSFDVPLLSRFKHYGPASSYMKIGCLLHNLLPRALANLRDNTSAVSADVAGMIDALLADTSMPLTSTQGGLSEDDIQAGAFAN